jgi:uncharacterized protein (TIGR02246 family)
MKRSALLTAAAMAVAALAGWLATTTRPTAVVAQQPAAQPSPAAVAPGDAEAGVRAMAAEYARAFNAGDARAAAALWTDAGEYQGADGAVLRGRAAIEKKLAAFFKVNPKARAEVRVESVKAMGRGLAHATGVVAVKLPGHYAASESRYVALYVPEDGKWLAASVREWVPDPATALTPKQLEWLLGEWTSRGQGGSEVKMVYAWDDDKVFITGKYTVTKDGKTVSKGTQVIGRNPAGGLRSWMFDNTGTTSDGLWTHDGDHWVNKARGVLPDGMEVHSVNVIIPLGPDAFTWQTTEREIDGVRVAALPPIKVTRVKK